MVARLFAATVAASLGLALSASAQCGGATGCGGQTVAVAHGYATPAVAGCDTCGTGGQAVAAAAPTSRRGLFARRSGRTTTAVAQPTMLAAAPAMMATPMTVAMPTTTPTTVTGTGIVQTGGTMPPMAMPMPTTVAPATTPTTSPTPGTIVIQPQQPVPATVIPVETTGTYYPTATTTPTQRRGLFSRIFRR